MELPVTRLFGTQGFRGIVNQELTSIVAHDLGLALANFVGRKKIVGLGWDTRISSDMISFAFSAGLMTGGCDVHVIGLVPTPLLSYAIPHLELDGGAMITASHNPPEYNGIKLWGPDGAAYTQEMERQVETYYFAEQKTEMSWRDCGQLVAAEDFRLQYIEGLLAQVDEKRLKERGFRVAADCGGGAASMVAPILLNAINAETELLFCDPDGLFSNRPPEPKKSNLSKLIACVKENNLDCGIAWDGDADRVIFVTERGRFLPGDRVFALAAFHILRDLQEKPKRIVTQVATSDVIHEIAAAIDAEVIETRVGEPFVVTKMKEQNAAIGGEENGGVIYRGWSWTREGLLTALVILDLLAAEDKTLDKMDQQFSMYHQEKKGIVCTPEEKNKIIETLREVVSSDAKVSDADGIKLRYSDGWVLLRPSGTEPLFRIFAEAKSNSRVKDLVNQGTKMVEETIKEIRKNK